MAARIIPIEDMPDRILDGIVEEAFFACKVHWNDDEAFRVDKDSKTGITLEAPVAFYSSDIRDAWRIVEVLRARGLKMMVAADKEDVSVKILGDKDDVLAESRAKITPRALAEAAARMGERVKDIDQKYPSDPFYCLV